jgi:DNA-binding LacI/PurR family transcriptional regulator/signal transduction histidine kinase/ActR/RegA family two-component response regulator
VEVRSERKTIGVLMGYLALFTGTYDAQIRNAFQEKCREHDLNLLTVYAGALGDPRLWSVDENSVFDLMHPDCVDGLVLISSCLTSLFGLESVHHLAQLHRSLPLCSIGVAIPGVPSIVIDNRGGMEAVLEHLIGEHGCRRPAFIAGAAGNPEAEVRFRAYQDVLGRHGLELDPALVVDGNFTNRDAQTAMEQLLLHEVEFDAVAAASDNMAFGAMAVLRKHGRRVPLQLPVTGFDDVQMARLDSPPLTTVAQPFAAMAGEAIRVVLEQLAGRPVAECVELPALFLVRQSCGCGVRTRLTTPVARDRTAQPAAEYIRTHCDSLVRALMTPLGITSPEGLRVADRLLAALAPALAGNPDPFLHTIEQLLESSDDDPASCRALENTVTCLRDELRSCAEPALEDLWHDARDLIAHRTQRGQVQERIDLDNDYLRIVDLNRHLTRAVDLPSLKQALLRMMPLLGISNASFSRYADGSSTELEPWVCMLNGHQFDPPPVRFAAHRLVPAGIWYNDRRRTRLVFPLLCEGQRWGVAVFEYTGATGGFQMLQDQVSVALSSIRLHQQVLEKTVLHERSVQERQATAARMAALSVLSGGVAHDLNNVLGPMVALPDVILEDLNRLAPELRAALTEICDDLRSIKGASLRAAQTIKDLLTLGRERRVGTDPLDLNALVSDCLTLETLGFMPEDLSEVEVSHLLCEEPLIVRAAEAHLVRAITNLVRNALEALDGPGQVSVTTRAVDVTQPLLGYEVVPPGNYAVITVSDTGRGIDAAGLARVFEPFFSSKRIRPTSGSGLGLAVVHGVVKEHDGYLDVTSRPGHGTSFALFFPRLNVALDNTHRTSSLPRGRAKVLVVDDEPTQLRTASRVLGQLGYEIDTLRSGAAAREVFASFAAEQRANAFSRAASASPYDLIIVDMALNEDEDGLGVVERIRAIFPGQRALIASGNAPPERAEAAILLGLGWLSKPYTSGALARAVEAALGGCA